MTRGEKIYEEIKTYLIAEMATVDIQLLISQVCLLIEIIHLALLMSMDREESLLKLQELAHLPYSTEGLQNFVP